MVGVLLDTKVITPNLTITYLSRNGQGYPDEVYTLMSEKHLVVGEYRGEHHQQEQE